MEQLLRRAASQCWAAQELGERCDKGEANACLVAGLRAITHEAVEEGKGADTETYFQRACNLNASYCPELELQPKP